MKYLILNFDQKIIYFLKTLGSNAQASLTKLIKIQNKGVKKML